MFFEPFRFIALGQRPSRTDGNHIVVVIELKCESGISGDAKDQHLTKKAYNNPPKVSTFLTPKSFSLETSSKKPTSIPLLSLWRWGNFCSEGRMGGVLVCRKFMTMRMQV